MRTRHIIAPVVICASLLSSCAYYNTFYNAKQLFKQAESERVANTSGGGAGSYQQCIEKCRQLLRYYPDSKYVDDALFLIGMSRLYRGEYVQARASFESVLERFPQTEYAERAYYYMGIASLEQGDTSGWTSAFETLLQKFPKSALNVEAQFRVADAHVETRDYEKAREELRAFMSQYPKSRLVSEAQLRLARTYYEEERFADARREYQHVLKSKVPREIRFEAELRSALALRQEAEAMQGLSASGTESEPQAQEMLTRVAVRLADLDKLAGRLGRHIELDIERAVTQALRGQPDEAISALDEIARVQKASELTARAHYEIAEIYRRLGDLEEAEEAYQSASVGRQQSQFAQTARIKKAAIQSRAKAMEELDRAPEILERWRAGDLPDSLEAQIGLRSEFERLASELLRVAEIDLWELDQPLLALREFETLLEDYEGSLPCARAAFAVAWIYEHKLQDTERARKAYEFVVRDYGATPQGRKAVAVLEDGLESRSEP